MDIQADINYLPATEGPIAPDAWTPRYHGVPAHGTRTVTIRDVRGREDRFSLDANGFRFVTLPPDTPSLADGGAAIHSAYRAVLEGILKRLTGASTVHIFNHTVRRCSDPFAKGRPDPAAPGQPLVPPSGHPHVDYSARAADVRGTLAELRLPPAVRARFDDDDDAARRRRFALVNVWRPLAPVRRDPLAVADAATVPDGDYVVRERRFRPSGVRSGNYVLAHGEGHAWYWMSDMRPDEAVVFRQLDSRRDAAAGPGWRCPHTAFVLPGTEHLPPRESVEVRAVCFWD